MMADDMLVLEFMVCRQLGGMTVEEMRGRMSHAELMLWRAFYMRRSADPNWPREGDRL